MDRLRSHLNEAFGDEDHCEGDLANAGAHLEDQRPHEWPRRPSIHEMAFLAAVRAAEGVARGRVNKE